MNLPQIDAIDINTNCDEPIVIGQPVPLGAAAPSCFFSAEDTSLPPELPGEPEPVTPTTDPPVDPTTAALPATGGNTHGLAVAGALLVGCGIALIRLARQRSPVPVPEWVDTVRR